jgi:hypothetical protein
VFKKSGSISNWVGAAVLAASSAMMQCLLFLMCPVLAHFYTVTIKADWLAASA